MGSYKASEDTMSKALSVVLQHPAVAADQQNVCRLIQVCKAWRKAVQQSDACLTNVNFSRQLIDTGGALDMLVLAAEIVAQLGGFAQWLSMYPGTVGSLHLNLGNFVVNNTLDRLELHAHQVLALSLRLATTASANSSTTFTAGAAATPPLQLRSFTCSSRLVSSAIISALPAAALTRLEITVPSKVLVHEALSKLSNLRSLNLNSSGRGLSNYYLSSINRLSKLKRLTVGEVQGPSGLTLLPQQVSELNLTMCGRFAGDSERIDLSSCAQLRKLTAYIPQQLEALILPEQLQSLGVTCLDPLLSVSNVTSLQWLEQLTIHDTLDPHTKLLMLEQMQHIKSLNLGYGSSGWAVVAAPVWPQLQHLMALRLSFSCNAVTIHTMLEAIQPLTWLTGLTLNIYWDHDDEMEDAHNMQAVQHAMERMSHVCQSLKHLANLRDLELDLNEWVDLDGSDLMHLSCLTALTRLWLRSDHLENTTAVNVMLLELTKLQELSLIDPTHISVLPIIAKLQGLTSLSLHGLLNQSQGLLLLTRLRNLQELHGFDNCSRAELKQFWADLHAVA